MAIAQIGGGIRPAATKDLHSIMDIVRQAVSTMRAEGSDQWDETYPQIENFVSDIAEAALFVDTDGGHNIRGVVCLNFDEPEQYLPVAWAKQVKALVIHRMAVALPYRGSGVAGRLMDFAEQQARELGLRYIKSDTYSANPRMNALFEKWGYSLRGHIRFDRRVHQFNCWDKVLAE